MHATILDTIGKNEIGPLCRSCGDKIALTILGQYENSDHPEQLN